VMGLAEPTIIVRKPKSLNQKGCFDIKLLRACV
jgi:hypothetical protein